MLHAQVAEHILHFLQPAITSRNVMTHRRTYYVRIWHEESPDVRGVGECGVFAGLSCEDALDYAETLKDICKNINRLTYYDLRSKPSIAMGIESAMADLRNGGRRVVFDTPFVLGQEYIDINGLVWMGSKEQMSERIAQKVAQGFRCIKLKIGGIDFSDELHLIRGIRSKYTHQQLQIRLDANGAFPIDKALDRLRQLSPLAIHSIEQPIPQGHHKEMAALTRKSPIAIALDEELIGVNTPEQKMKLLEDIHPHYIILKPTLCGGLTGTQEWISMARLVNSGWWLTSALESNVGLNAIAQLASYNRVTMPQGLGTGMLYTDNIPSPLMLEGESLRYDRDKDWDLSAISWQ